MSAISMPNINQVAISGRIVKDPDFRFMENGTARLRARVAVERSYRDRNQEWQEQTSYFDVILWQKAAETLCKRLKGGTAVFITGRLESHSWRDEHNESHQRVNIHVRNLQILSKEESDELLEPEPATA